jgi:hypothetical protein
MHYLLQTIGIGIFFAGLLWWVYQLNQVDKKYFKLIDKE